MLFLNLTIESIISFIIDIIKKITDNPNRINIELYTPFNVPYRVNQLTTFIIKCVTENDDNMLSTPENISILAIGIKNIITPTIFPYLGPNKLKTIMLIVDINKELTPKINVKENIFPVKLTLVNLKNNT